MIQYATEQLCSFLSLLFGGVKYQNLLPGHTTAVTEDSRRQGPYCVRQQKAGSLHLQAACLLFPRKLSQLLHSESTHAVPKKSPSLDEYTLSVYNFLVRYIE